MYFYLQFPNPFISDDVNFHDNHPVTGQALLDYLATYLDIHYRVQKQQDDPEPSAKFTFTNTGQHEVPPSGWAIYYTGAGPLGILGEQLQYNGHALVAEGAMKLVQIQGAYYRLEPTLEFKSLLPHSTFSFNISGLHRGRTKYGVAYPNWYVWSSGLEPQVIECTKSESLDFASGFEPEDHNGYDYLSNEERYDVNDMLDTGGATKPVIPTPLHMLREPGDHMLRLGLEYEVVYIDRELYSEANYLKG